MEESSGNVQILIKTINSDGIVMRNTKQFTEKGEEIKTTEYFLDLQQTTKNGETEYVTIEGEDDSQFVSLDVDNSQEIVLNDKQVIIWDELCRICAKSNEQNIPIFSDQGLDHDLHSKIQKYLPLKISENDSLPQGVCYDCAATLLSWHDLFKNCHSAQEKLIELQNKLHSKDELYNETSTGEENIENVMTLETVDNDDEDFELALKEEEEEVEEEFVEIENKAKIEDVSDISKNVVSNRSASVRAPITKSLETKLVKKEPTSKCNADNDVRAVPDKLIDNVLPNSSSKSSTKKNNKCRKKSKSEKKASADVNMCNECGKLFTVKESLKRHLRIHKNERPYTCYVCGKQFRDSGGLCRHLRDVHAKVKNHACDECGRSFASRSTLDDHLRTHTGERPFICDSCGNRFKSKASLYTHAKTHTDDFPHVCVYCSKKFRRKQELLCHISTHTGEKNYECDVCFRRFRVKTELKRHTLVHSNLKPFVCDICGFSCRQKRYLNNHVKQKHNTVKTDNIVEQTAA